MYHFNLNHKVAFYYNKSDITQPVTHYFSVGESLHQFLTLYISEIECGGGFYVRSLVHDLGKGGYLGFL